jgi:hypothetical protein
MPAATGNDVVLSVTGTNAAWVNDNWAITNDVRSPRD